MARCAGTKPDGSPCERIVGASQTFCYSHDESRASERSRNASKAAKAKAGELAEIKARIKQLIEDVLAGEVSAREAAVAISGYGVLRQYVSEERQREVLKLEERLSALEKELGLVKGGRWAG